MELNETGTYIVLQSRPGEKGISITPASLCACSALPLIEQTVQIDGDIYCEGALVDTVNFEDLIEDHPDLDEIWISRIVDAGQILPPKNILISTANLCELFSGYGGRR